MRIKALGLIGLVVSLLLLATSWAYGHPGQITVCNPDLKGKKVRYIGDGMLQNGMYAEAYDTNGDKKPDVITWSHVHATERVKSKKKDNVKVIHDPFPVFYLVDLDFDGRIDKVYIDKTGEGNCKDIVLYEDLTLPGATRGATRGSLVGD